MKFCRALGYDYGMARRVLILLLCAWFLSACGQVEAAVPYATSSPTATHSASQTLEYSPSALPARKTAGPTAQPAQTPTLTRTPRPAQPTGTIEPTATLPPSAEIKGIYGYGQLQALSCEARSAADWARHFGVTIHEMEFMARLPRSNNPEEGFVGSPNGGWGAIPPDAYGVHAGPVARVLQSYGAQASAVKNLTLYDLQAEIAAGRPVIVWVTGHVWPGERSIYSVDGKDIVVARREHTVIAIGYDGKNVKFLDGKNVYQRPVDTFLLSWGVLENMAILWEPQGNLRTE